jgi:hypothetical protein
VADASRLPRRHLFLVTGRASYGEPIAGLAMARALHDAGDQVAFLHPSSLHPLFQGVPFPRATIDVAEFDLVRALRRAIEERGFETLVLVDVTLVLMTSGERAGRGMLDLPVRVLGLDYWNLPETNLVWDLGATELSIPRLALAIPSVRPSPIARPGAPGAYRALPEVQPLSDDERTMVRRALGIGERQRLLLTATATWQQPQYHTVLDTVRVARHGPEIFALLLRRLPEDVHLAHVGPAPFDWGAGHARYRFLPQLPPAEFRRLMAACDTFLSLNLPATSVAAAIACGTPAVVLTNDLRGTTLAEVERAAGGALAADVRPWVERMLPLHPFRICPGGLHRFLAPVLAGNPFQSALRELPITAVELAAQVVGELLEGGPARAALVAAQAALREANAGLPSLLERFREISAGPAPAFGRR